MVDYNKRQNQIIEAAIEVIAESSIQALTVKRLAEKIGISDAALYRHFKNKMEILEAVLCYFEGERKIFFDKVIDSTEGAIEKIESIFQHHLALFTRKPALAAVIFSEDIFLNDEYLAKKVLVIMAQAQASFLKIISSSNHGSNRLREDVPVEHLAVIILGSLRLIVTKWHLGKHNFDLIKEGETLWSSLRKIILEPLMEQP